MSGLGVSENQLGWTAVRLHYSCDPAKDPHTDEGAAWLEKAKRAYPDPHKWATEMEINWWITAGARVYPEFIESDHCRPAASVRRKVLYRAWDFGYHAPACLIAQIDAQDRLLVLKEVIGHEQTTRDFAKQVIAQCAEWFPTHSAGYDDCCDPAGQQRNATAEASEVRDVEILSALGIYPRWEHGWSRKDGRALIHQLLVLRHDFTPSLYVDQAGCPVLVQGFLGKFVYPTTRDGRAHDEPDESNHPWADAQAALRYLATRLYSALGLRRFRYQPVMKSEPVEYHGYGTPTRGGRTRRE